MGLAGVFYISDEEGIIGTGAPSTVYFDERTIKIIKQLKNSVTSRLKLFYIVVKLYIFCLYCATGWSNDYVKMWDMCITK